MSIGEGYRLVQQNDKLRLVIEPFRHIKDASEKLEILRQLAWIIKIFCFTFFYPLKTK